jgi:hypothetical protein
MKKIYELCPSCEAGDLIDGVCNECGMTIGEPDYEGMLEDIEYHREQRLREP